MIKKLMMLCVAAMAAMGAWAEVYYDWYSNDDGVNTITLSGVYVDGVMPNPLVIPSEYDGRTVTRISLEESDIRKAKSILLPNSLLAIEDNIFVDCMQLEKVDVLPGGKYKTRDNMLLSVDEKELVAVYGKASFSRTSLAIPDMVEIMGWWALFGSQKLKSVEIPKNVREIKGNPFVCCYALENISLHPANSAYKIENELLLTKDGKKLIATAGSYTKKRRDIVVPEGVEEICELSLTSDMVDIRNVWMPKTLKVLHDALEWGGNGGKNGEYGAMENVVFQSQEKFEIVAGACLFCDCDINNVWFAGPVPKNFYSEEWWECGNVRKIHYTAEYKDEWEEALRKIGYANRGQVNRLEEFPKPPAQQDTTIIQESYGPFTPGVDVELNLGLVGYTAKKLPSGLKLDKKTGIVKGKAKKPGEYQVTFTKKGAETLTAKFIVGPMPTITITMEGDTEKCKVTGASKPGKGYLVGKKVSLSAKGPKGTAFTGWFKDGLPWPNATEYLESKLKYVMTEENLSLVARFEKEKMSVACDRLSTLTVGEEVSMPIAIETQSGVKSVKGSKLPSGLKVKKDKATGEWFVTGKPKKVGTWNTTIKVTAKSGAVEQLPVMVTVEDKGDVDIPSANHYFREPLKNGEGEKYVVSVGISNVEDFLPNLKLTRGSLNVSGLPEGLKYDAASGKITGIATKSGTYTVTLTVTDGKEKYVSTITVEVEALPDWVVGTFNGYYTLEGYHGPSKEHGVYNKYEHDYTDGRIHWEMAEPIYVKVDSKGKVIFEWPEPGTVVESTGLQREGDGSFSFHFRFREHAGGPWLEYEEGSAKVVFYRNETLSKKIGFDVGEVECYLNGIDGYNDYYDEYYFAQKRSSDDFIKRAFSNVKGQYKTFEFKNVYSSADIHGHSFNGNLKVGIDSSGNVYSIWTPKDRPNVIKKTENSKFILRDYDSKNGDIYGEIAVLVVDFNNKEGDFMEYTLFFDVAVADGELYIMWDDSRVIIHE